MIALVMLLVQQLTYKAIHFNIAHSMLEPLKSIPGTGCVDRQAPSTSPALAPARQKKRSIPCGGSKGDSGPIGKADPDSRSRWPGRRGLSRVQMSSNEVTKGLNDRQGKLAVSMYWQHTVNGETPR